MTGCSELQIRDGIEVLRILTPPQPVYYAPVYRYIPPPDVNCTSQVIGNMIYTNCY